MPRGMCCAPWVAGRFAWIWALCVVTWAAAGSVRAGVVSPRAEVAADLGAGAMEEDFEKFPAADDTNYAFGHQIDADTVAQHAGPGLVNAGLTFSAADNSFLTWNGMGANGQMSRDLGLIVLPGESAAVDFATPTPAVGMDLIGSGAANAPPVQTLRMAVLGADGVTVMDTIDLTLARGTPVFFGFVAPDGAAGIGQVLMENPTGVWELPSLDNLLYGSATAVPLPGGGWGGVAGVLVMGLGSAIGWRRRRRVSEAGSMRLASEER